MTDGRIHEEITSRDLIDQARFEDIARRLLMQQTPRQIAKAHDISERQLRRLLRDPRMIDVFERAKDDVFSNLDRTIKDEKAAPLLRARAQAIRAQTLLAQIMDEVQGKIEDGMAKATHLKVGMETAFGVIDRSKTEIGTEGGDGSANVEFNISLQQGTASIFGEAVRESGIDLSDVLVDIAADSLGGDSRGDGPDDEGSPTPVQERDQEAAAQDPGESEAETGPARLPAHGQTTYAADAGSNSDPVADE